MRPNFGMTLPRRLDATTAIVAILGIGALLTLLVPGLASALIYEPDLALRRPWTPLTYPMVIPIMGGLGGPFFTVFLLFWTYQIGRSLESAMGTPRFAGLWAFGTLFPALLFAIPGLRIPLAGPLFPVSVLTVAWATRSANAQVLLMMIIPIAAKWIGWLFALGVFATYYSPAHPVTALVSLVPLAVTWAFAAGRIPGMMLAQPLVEKPTKEQRRREEEFREEIQRRKDDRAEKERLRRLLEGPSSDDLDARR